MGSKLFSCSSLWYDSSLASGSGLTRRGDTTTTQGGGYTPWADTCGVLIGCVGDGATAMALTFGSMGRDSTQYVSVMS